eukprot:COSAG01_NODE_1540_length_9985_cov_7.634855_2_plen_86_part_00
MHWVPFVISPALLALAMYLVRIPLPLVLDRTMIVSPDLFPLPMLVADAPITFICAWPPFAISPALLALAMYLVRIPLPLVLDRTM